MKIASFLFFMIFILNGEASYSSCEIKVGIPSVMSKKDPIKAMSWWEKRQITLQFDTLVRFGVHGEINPWLAKKWTVGNDSKFFSFQIREGVRLTDGTPVTGSIVAESLKRYFGKESVDRDRLKDVESVIVVGEFEVEIKLKKPFIPLLYYLATPRSSISKKISTEHFVGSGPWIPSNVSVEKQSDISKWVRNINYFHGAPICESLSLVQVPNDSVGNAIKNKQIDLIEYYSGNDLSRDEIKKKFGSEAIAIDFPSYDVTALFFSLKKMKSHGTADRKYLRNLINSELKQELIGKMDRVCSILPFGLSYNSVQCLSSRAEAAKPKNIEIFIQKDERALLIEQLSKSAKFKGTNIHLNLVTLKQMYEEHSKGNVAVHVETLTMQIPDPFGVLSLFVTGSPENFSGYSNFAFDSIVEKAVKEQEVEKRSKLYKKAEKILLEDAIVVPLVHQSRMAVFLKNVSGYDASSVGPFYASYNKIFVGKSQW